MDMCFIVYRGLWRLDLSGNYDACDYVDFSGKVASESFVDKAWDLLVNGWAW